MTTAALHSRETWIGLLLGLVVTAALPMAIARAIDMMNPSVGQGGARRIKAVADIFAIEEALQLFRGEHGRLPTAKEGIPALVQEQLERVPMDPWGHAYVYVLEGENARVASYGSDGQPEGGDDGADITHERGSKDWLPEIPSKTIPDAAANALFLGSVLLLPLVAFRASSARLWAVGALAGAATLLAILPLALGIAVLLDGEIRAWIPFGIGLVFGAAAIAVFLRVRFADGAALAGISLLVAGMWVLSGMIAR